MTDFLDQSGLPVDWTQIQAVIFDVDGTLYRQQPVRIGMAFRLAGYFLLHPLQIKELLGIYHFRKLRESPRFQASSLDAQIREAAKLAGLQNTDRLKEAIQRWMFREPLSLIQKHGNPSVLALLKRLQTEGKRILIYSDYAPEEKLAALEIHPDAVYYPGCRGIEELKPSGKSVRWILKDQGLSVEKTVYLGDRDEKDGKSAQAVGMRFIHITS